MRARVRSQIPKTTLLDLLVSLQARGHYSEDALVAIAASLVKSGRVALCGIYANSRALLN